MLKYFLFSNNKLNVIHNHHFRNILFYNDELNIPTYFHEFF